MFNVITNINETKTLTKYISYQCKCKFYDTNCKSNQWWNDNKCRCECKKQNIFQKNMFGIVVHVFVKMENI